MLISCVEAFIEILIGNIWVLSSWRLNQCICTNIHKTPYTYILAYTQKHIIACDPFYFDTFHSTS